MSSIVALKISTTSWENLMVFKFTFKMHITNMNGLISWQIAYITNLVLAKILILMGFNLAWTSTTDCIFIKFNPPSNFPTTQYNFLANIYFTSSHSASCTIYNCHITKDKVFTCLKSLNYNQWISALHFSIEHFMVINNWVSFLWHVIDSTFSQSPSGSQFVDV